MNCFVVAVTFKPVGSNQASATEVSSLPVYAPRLDAKRGDSFLQADFPLVIAVSQHQITSIWPTINPDPGPHFREPRLW